MAAPTGEVITQTVSQEIMMKGSLKACRGAAQASSLKK